MNTAKDFIVVKVKPEHHKTLSNLVNHIYEIGGAFKLNSFNGELSFDKIYTIRKYDEVDIPIGIVQFHTHPSPCVDFRCALPIPSVADVIGFTRSCLRRETIAHIVYTIRGAYLILLTEKIRDLCRKNRSHKEIFLRNTEDHLSDIVQQYKENLGPFDSFQNRWLNVVHHLGFDVRVFELNTVPYFRLFMKKQRAL